MSLTRPDRWLGRVLYIVLNPAAAPRFLFDD